MEELMEERIDTVAIGRYPKWIIGPSGPTGSPEATAQTQEKNLTTIVLTLKIWRTIVPLRKPISSGIPEPAAEGRINWNE